MNAEIERRLRRIAEQKMPADGVDKPVEVSLKDLRELVTEHRKFKEALKQIMSPSSGLSHDGLRRIAATALIRAKGRPRPMPHGKGF